MNPYLDDGDVRLYQGDVIDVLHRLPAAGYVLHHWCENKLCLNVDHMEAVTRGDHVRIHRKGKPMVGGWQANA